MRWTAIGAALALCLGAGTAWAASTKDFIYRCSSDEAGCLARIKEVRRIIENPPPGQRAPARLCIPSGMSDEGLVAEVTYWIDEQIPSLDNKTDFDSIAAALTALYSCGGVRGLDGE